jgi:hypothetical protein
MPSSKWLHNLSKPRDIDKSSTLCNGKIASIKEDMRGWMIGVINQNGLMNWISVSDLCKDPVKDAVKDAVKNAVKDAVKDIMVQLIKMSIKEAVFDVFFVMFGEAIWTLLYEMDPEKATQITMALINEHQ